jgi:hypothetical protein
MVTDRLAFNGRERLMNYSVSVLSSFWRVFS